jgi:hypothetical protein
LETSRGRLRGIIRERNFWRKKSGKEVQDGGEEVGEDDNEYDEEDIEEDIEERATGGSSVAGPSISAAR